MAISKKLRSEFITLGCKLAPTFAMVTVVVKDMDLSFDTVDLDIGSPAERWQKLIDHTDFNGKIGSLIEGVISVHPGNKTIKDIKKEYESQDLLVIINDLKQIIESERCVLFLGPDALMVRSGMGLTPFNRILSQKFSERLDQLQIYYDPDQKLNLSYLIDRFESSERITIGKTETFAKEIYINSVIDDQIFRMIEQLKFPLIINTNPDTRLNELFGQNRFPSTYYDFSSTSTPSVGDIFGKSGVCQVYNIYGSFDNPYSIVFTEKEAVEFARKTYERNPLIPKQINEVVNKCYGLFIGFNFNDWHLKILFDVLELREKPLNYSITGLASNCPEYMREYFERRYDMKFIKNDVEQILRMLR